MVINKQTMSLKTFLLFLFFLILSILGESQDYSIGFKYLDEGKFDKASSFFQERISEGYNDITVRLCYGRAVGLNGKPESANILFKELLNENPQNYELELNLAESYMWMHDYKEAKSLYEKLINKDNKSFPAILGYANALSSLKIYEQAKDYIDQAISLQPDNANAKISRKYILLGLAESYKLSNNFLDSKKILESLMILNPNDIDIGLSLAYLCMDLNSFKEANKTLDTLLQNISPNYRTYLAKSSLMLRKIDYQKAIKYVELAKTTFEENNPGRELPFDLIIQNVDTYIACDKHDKAQKLITDFMNSSRDSFLIDKLKFNLYLGQKDYEKIRENSRHYGNTELYHQVHSKMYFQRKDYRSCRLHLDSLLALNNESVFHFYMSKELDKSTFSNLKSSVTFAKDNGGNNSRESIIGYESNNYNKVQFLFHIKNRTTSSFKNEKASQMLFQIGAKYKLSNDLKLESSLGLSVISGSNKKTILNHTKVTYNLNEKLNISLSFNQRFYDYSASLIESKTKENKLTLQYFTMFSKNEGMYFQGSKSELSDSNSSEFYYASFFKNIKNNPLLQLGINVMYLGYGKNSENYFSPNNYKAGELFIKFDNRHHPNKILIYSVSGAIGKQVFANSANQSTQRFEIEAGIKWNRINHILLFLRYNNSSSASVTGYQISSYGLQANINW